MAVGKGGRSDARPLPFSDGVNHRFVDLPDLRMHVAEAGAGPPIILLHTVFQHWYAWRHVMPVLARHYWVICPDLRGCGWTDAPSHGYEKEALAADVVDLIAALGLERVRLVGHSLGGLVGFLVALRHPERVDQLLAVGVTHPWPTWQRVLPRAHRSWYQWLAASPGLGPWVVRNCPGLTRWVLRGTSPRPDAWPDDVVGAFAAPLADPSRALAVAAMYRVLLLHELVPILRGRYRSLRLRPPTLLLLGGRDWFFSPSVAEGYEPYADDLRLEILPEAGHFIPEEDPALLADRTLRFFGEGG